MSRLMYRQSFTFTAEFKIVVEMRQCILQCVYTGNGLCSVEGNSRSERPADSVEKDKTNICLFIWSGILMSLGDRGKARTVLMW